MSRGENEGGLSGPLRKGAAWEMAINKDRGRSIEILKDKRELTRLKDCAQVNISCMG